MVHEDAAVSRGGELTAVVIHPVQAFDVIDYFPRLFRAEESNWETFGMKRNVVLAHELDIAHVFGAIVLSPPTLPVTFRRVRPFHRCADVFNRSIEPDVEDLAFKARPRLTSIRYRNSPGQIASDAAILQSFIEPLACDRRYQDRPVGLGINPFPQTAYHLGLL